jgi:hypothetical protein
MLDLPKKIKYYIIKNIELLERQINYYYLIEMDFD